MDVYSAMATQWHVAGMGTVVGMVYSSLEFVMKTLRVGRRKECFSKVRILESEHLLILRERERDGSKA